MLDITEIEKGIFHVEIKNPRMVNDEDLFLTFLSKSLLFNEFRLILSIEGEKKFTKEGRKNLGIWFKANKEELGLRCLGFIRLKDEIIHPNDKKLKSMQLAMPCPYNVHTSLDGGLKWLKDNSNHTIKS